MAIKFEKVSFTYNVGTPFEYPALKEINFEIKDNSFVALVGHTGSGKSTLMQLFNGLLKPTVGKVEIDNFSLDTHTPNKDLKPLRKKVGLVFQLPENQLFEENILKEVMFGPLNFGFSRQEAEESAKLWLKKVGIASEFYHRSPFDLSGGQKRRVAIASVMASKPDILCLDEPAAGLDPEGKKELYKLLEQYHQQGHTIVVVTHDMEDIVDYAEEMLVLEEGKLIAQDKTDKLFNQSNWLKKHHLLEPKIYGFKQLLSQKGFSIKEGKITLTSLVEDVIDEINRREPKQ
ncbi:energy-coupling factor transporter ATPase [Lactobacillus sp. PV012]|uniref:energy-coupling factor transporter ATPase n=1 Tax=Lactobacillus sp. PV012 TaxID=2594494 RepID=UPI00223F2DBE|nr:energy-coupling factor transporter ATPase [Lactobacillus sp. PV012]QNQ81843.1 energy-coupling factor transporter ATPase [Lactobacillus sp. PV012]